jgi:ComF family protein
MTAQVDPGDVLQSLLFPPVCIGCRSLLRGAADDRTVCRACEIGLVPLPAEERTIGGIEALWAYHGPLASALHRLKYSGDAAVAGPLGRLLGKAPSFARSTASGVPWDDIVPVPLHRLRVWQRGYNQAALIARWAVASRPSSACFCPQLLRRRRATPPQTDLSLGRRLENVRGAFTAPEPGRVEGRRVLVVDDVTTTGATLRACLAALTEAGASEVGALALLRTLA